MQKLLPFDVLRNEQCAQSKHTVHNLIQGAPSDRQLVALDLLQKKEVELQLQQQQQHEQLLSYALHAT